jgi:spore maturation protein CgeB
MTKVLYLPLNYGPIIQTGTYDAFREAGCELQIFDYFTKYLNNRKRVKKVREEFIREVRSFQPDLVHMQIQHTNVINGAAVKAAKSAAPKAIFSNWTGDVRSFVPPTFRDVGKSSDFNFVSSTGQLEMFEKQIGKPVHYLQIGYNPKLYYPNFENQNFEWDCCFIAHFNAKEKYPGTQERTRTCELLRNKFGNRFRLYGDGWPKRIGSKGSIDQKTLIGAYHKSRVLISVSHFNEIDHYFSDRLLMCMASGRPVVQYHFPKYESYFTNNSDLVIAHSPAEIVKKVDWLVKNPDMADFIGRSGAAKVFAEHTYLSRINELLNKVGLK